MTKTDTKWFDDFANIVRTQSDERQKEIAEWNEKNPPTKEIQSQIEDQTVTTGIWQFETGDYGFAEQMANGLYNPYQIVLLDKELVKALIDISQDQSLSQ